MVADGVGGREGGEAASRMTVETMALYATHAMQCYFRANEVDDSEFLAELQAAALEKDGDDDESDHATKERCHPAIGGGVVHAERPDDECIRREEHDGYKHHQDAVLGGRSGSHRSGWRRVISGKQKTRRTVNGAGWVEVLSYQITSHAAGSHTPNGEDSETGDVVFVVQDSEVVAGMGWDRKAKVFGEWSC